MTFVHDHHRQARIGMSEAVLCDAKPDALLVQVVAELATAGRPALLTRLETRRLALLPDDVRRCLDHDPVSRTGVLNGCFDSQSGRVAVVAAGTSDVPVAAEAARTLEFSGHLVDTHYDVGVAGLWRLLDRIEEIRKADVVIAVAGMDAALLSVVGGLVHRPVIGVPTSVGYGVATGGTSALHSMLSSCAQGLLVTNIDNGFGAASAAIRILRAMDRRQAPADAS